MAQRYTVQRRSSSNSLMVFGLVLVGVVGGMFLLHSSGAINLPFLGGDDAPPPPDRTGMVPVVTCVRPIPAYARVEVKHILNPKTGKIQYSWLRPEEIPEDAAREPRDVLGRVVRTEKPFGQIFMATEFYPKGTRPGPTAGVPPGKRAVRLAATEVPGLHGLRQGDRFDLVMTVEVDVEEPRRRGRRRHEKLDVDGPWAPLHSMQTAEAAEKPYIVRRKADVQVIVRDGVVVQPVHQRKEVKKDSSLLQGSKLSAVPIEELIIAVRPEEVAALTQALTIEADLQVAMRSGQAGEEETSVSECEIPDVSVAMHDLRPDMTGADDEPDSKVRLVEVIEGGEKRIDAVPVEGKQKP